VNEHESWYTRLHKRLIVTIAPFLGWVFRCPRSGHNANGFNNNVCDCTRLYNKKIHCFDYSFLPQVVFAPWYHVSDHGQNPWGFFLLRVLGIFGRLL
jgi:hypothetical protein